MNKIIRIFFVFILVVNFFYPTLGMVKASTPSIAIADSYLHRTIPEIHPQPVIQTDVPGGSASGPDIHLSVSEIESLPHQLALWKVTANFPYSALTYTHSDILIFSYVNGTEIQVTDAYGYSLWTGTLNDGQHLDLKPGSGVYLIAGSKPFSAVVGDVLTSYVWGYYAMDQYGRGLSKLLYTYQSNWGSTAYDPHFIVFAYENNTHVTVKDSATGTSIWTGTLDAGKHYDNPSVKNKFLTVIADKPVSALSYTDQGYFVPAENGTFAGRTFHTFVGNAGSWVEDLNIIAYENTSILVSDSNTGALIWSGTLAVNEVKTISGLNGRYVTVKTSGKSVVSVHPSPTGNNPSGYYHSLYGQDISGTGIGTKFTFPVISGGKLVFFSYEDSNQIMIKNGSGTVVYNGTLNQGEWSSITTAATVYTITSSKSMSTIFDWGDFCGADFAPIYYGALQVDVLTPNGDTYQHGSLMKVAAIVTQLSQGLTGATVTGRIEISGPADTLTFRLNDQGVNGDQTANDAIYSAEVPLPDAARMPDGNYLVFVTAQATTFEGNKTSGTGVSNFTLGGSLNAGAALVLTWSGPTNPRLGDTINLIANVSYKDGIDRPDTIVQARILTSNLAQMEVVFSYQSPGVWTATYQFTSGGTYLINARALPPTGTSYAIAFASSRIQVLYSNTPLSIILTSLPGAYPKNQPLWIEATVLADGLLTDRAHVYAEISPGDVLLPLANQGNGKYGAAYLTKTAGTYHLTVFASLPYFNTNYASQDFTVTNASAEFAEFLNFYSSHTQNELESFRSHAQHVAEDGDYFMRKIPGDKFSTMFDLLTGIVGVYLDAGKVGESLVVDGFVRGYTPGLDNFQIIKGKTGIDGRMLESWSSRFTHAVRESLLDPKFSSELFPEGVGPKVFMRAMYAYVVKSAALGSFEAIGKLGENFLTNKLADLMTKPLMQGMLPILGEYIDQYKTEIGDYTQDTLVTVPPLTSEQEEQFRNDLQKRLDATIIISGNQFIRDATLFMAQDKREAESSLFYIIVNAVLHQALRIFVGVLTEGIGVVVFEAAWTGVELYNNLKDLEEDYAMLSMAQNSFLRMWEDESAIWDNTVAGLIQVREVTAPKTVQGDIVTFKEISRGVRCFLVKYCEQEVVTQISIKNTGNQEARFRPQACYSGQYKNSSGEVSHCIDSFRLEDGKTDMWITIPPQEQRSVELVFQSKNGQDVRPVNNTSISYYLFASNNTGTFLVDQFVSSFFPVEPSTYAQESSGETLELSTVLNSSFESIPYPIYLAAMPTGVGIDQALHIRAVNGFSFPINATIIQVVPENAVVSNPGGGQVAGNQITWRTVLEPYGTHGIDFSLALPGLPTEAVEISGTQVDMFISQENTTYTFYASGVTVNRRLPLAGEAQIPSDLKGNIETPAQITNWAGTAQSGVLTLSIYDLQENLVAQTEQNISVNADTTQSFKLVLSPNIPEGSYGVKVTLTQQGYTSTLATSLGTYKPLYRSFLPIIKKPPIQLIHNGNFEAGKNPWIVYSSQSHTIINNWSGINSSWGAYFCGTNNCYDYIEQSITVPSNFTTGYLNFYWAMISNEGSTYVYDTFKIKLLNSSGSTLATLLTLDNTDPENYFYALTIPVNLALYANQSIRLRFEARTDSTLVTRFYLDEVSLTNTSAYMPQKLDLSVEKGKEGE